MSHKEILANRAALQSDNPATQHDDLSGCENCTEELVFAMEDSFHQFSIGLRTILQCIDLAEANRSIPPLPDEWWNDVANRHNFFSHATRVGTMKLFKAKITDYKAHEISQENFEIQTHRRPPHYQSNSGKTAHYAVCPACENPIQIVGLYTPAKHTDKPFGRHVKKPIHKLAQYDQQAYDFCPYASHKLNLNKKQKKEKLTEREKRILTQLIEHFDQVAYILKEQTGIHLSRKLATEMLRAYKAEQGYLYYGANLLNVPWVFAYMSDNQKLWGRKIADSKLQERILAANPNISFDEHGILTSKAYSDINFWFTDHKRVNDSEGDLIESMQLVISESSKNIVTKSIEFDHSFFQSLLHVPDSKRPRKDEMVSVARKILGALL